MSNSDLSDSWKGRAFVFVDRLHELAGVLNRAHAELVGIVADALSDDSWAGGGIASPEHWLVLHAGLSRGRAAAIVALARRRGELPATFEHFEAGRLSLEQAGVIGRQVPAAFEVSVADMAQYATVPQVQRAVGKYPFVDPPADPGAPRPLHEPATKPAREPARLTTSFDGVGGFVLRYVGDAGVGALIEATLKEAKDARFRRDGVSPSSAQVFEDLMTGHLHGATANAPSRRDLYRVLVHLDVPGDAQRDACGDVPARSPDTSASGASGAARQSGGVGAFAGPVGGDGVLGWLNAGPRLPGYLIEALTCDAHGAVVAAGRDAGVVGSGQAVDPAEVSGVDPGPGSWVSLQGCPVGARGHVDVHHLIHWLDRGRSDPDNLLALCGQHHRRLHAGEFSIAGDPTLPEGHPGGLRFTTAHGLPITLAMPDPNADLELAPRYQGPTGEQLHANWVEFRPTG